MIFHVSTRSSYYKEKYKQIINEAFDCKYAIINCKHKINNCKNKILYCKDKILDHGNQIKMKHYHFLMIERK